MATSDFLPFATGAGSNVISQATYAALAAQQTGFQAGVANSAQLNKVWRQSSIMAAVLAQFIVNQTGQNAADDGTTATLIANLGSAVFAVAKTIGISAVLNPINASTTLTAANMGQSIPIFGSGGVTITLPSVSATTAGQRLEFFNYSGGTASVTCAGADSFVVTNGSSQTTLVLSPGDTLELESLGASGIWYAVGGSAQFQYSSLFRKYTAGAILNIRRFTASGTYTPTPGTLAVRVQLVGGGGGGGGSSATGSGQQSVGAGGAGGSYAESYITSAFSGVSMTIGAAGTAGAVAGSGGNGGTTSFGALLSAAGGGGGQPSGAAGSPFVLLGGAPGALPTTGNVLNAQGAPGGIGAGPAPATSTSYLSGAGGASMFGGGANGLGSANTAGLAGQSYGSGGSGGATGASAAGQAGGAGAAGVIIVTEYGNIQ